MKFWEKGEKMSVAVNVNEVVTFIYNGKIRIGWVDSSNITNLYITEVGLNHTKCFKWTKINKFRSFGLDAEISVIKDEDIKLELIDNKYIVSYIPEKNIKIDDNFIIKNGYCIVNGINVGLVPQTVIDWATTHANKK